MSIEDHGEVQYIGFWWRVCATIVDGILWGIISLPILLHVYGGQYLWSEDLIQGPLDFLLSWVFPIIAVILFWIYKGATPGKMAVSARIVDAQTGEHPSPAQFVGRCFSYFVSILPLGLGIIWVAIDKRKQGWHDKLAGTLVVRKDKGK